MNVGILLIALVAVCWGQTTITLQNGLSFSSANTGFTISGKASRSSFTFFIGEMSERDSNDKVVRYANYGGMSVGSFGLSNGYYTATASCSLNITDVSSGISNYVGEFSFQINVYTANSVSTWLNENITCPAGSVKLIPKITWLLPTSYSNHLSIVGTAGWDISALDLAEALKDGVSFTPVYSPAGSSNEVGANVGINGGLGLYFSFPGQVQYEPTQGVGSLSYSMTYPSSPSTTGTATYEVKFNTIDVTMQFDPVVHVTGSGAGSLVYSVSLIFLVLALIKLF